MSLLVTLKLKEHKPAYNEEKLFKVQMCPNRSNRIGS